VSRETCAGAADLSLKTNAGCGKLLGRSPQVAILDVVNLRKTGVALKMDNIGSQEVTIEVLP
jgi:hypothetical protein